VPTGERHALQAEDVGIVKYNLKYNSTAALNCGGIFDLKPHQPN
jgi:hypothetical protein